MQVRPKIRLSSWRAILWAALNPFRFRQRYSIALILQTARQRGDCVTQHRRGDKLFLRIEKGGPWSTETMRMDDKGGINVLG